MFQTLSFCFRIGGPPPLIEEILWFGDIGLANLITQSRCVPRQFLLTFPVYTASLPRLSSLNSPSIAFLLHFPDYTASFPRL